MEAAINNEERPESEVEADPPKKCCSILRFEEVQDAKGLNWLCFGRGPLIMSNIFLASSLIRLASVEAGCLFFDNDDTIETPPCENRIYGFKPSSLITNIAVIAGLLSAFFMPIIGAFIDYSAHRKNVGMISAFVMILIQLTQVWTVQATWFPMAILQALAAFVYQIQVLAVFSYYPDVGRIVSGSSMANFTSIFTITQFGASLIFLLPISIIAIQVGLDDVGTARMSQAVNVVWSGLAFFAGWRLMTQVPALQAKPKGQSYIKAGFIKTWNTAKGLNEHYGGSVRNYFLAVVFAEAGMNTFTSSSVTYLNEVIQMNGAEVGIVFAIVYLSSFPGSRLAYFVTKKTNPVMSWKLCFVYFSAATISGALVLTGPDDKKLTYIWAVLWGMALGWAYPTENLIFSLCLPKGQEAELTGFFVYCTQVIVWLPPIIFTAINESGAHMKYALMSLVIFFVIAFVFLMMMDPWQMVLQKAADPNRMCPPIQIPNELFDENANDDDENV